MYFLILLLMATTNSQIFFVSQKDHLFGILLLTQDWGNVYSHFVPFSSIVRCPFVWGLKQSRVWLFWLSGQTDSIFCALPTMTDLVRQLVKKGCALKIWGYIVLALIPAVKPASLDYFSYLKIYKFCFDLLDTNFSKMYQLCILVGQLAWFNFSHFWALVFERLGWMNWLW